MSFKDTYYRYYPELITYGRQLQAAEADLEDLVQETFLRYHVELSKKVIIRNKRAWLYKVFHNLVLTRIHSKRIRRAKITEYKMTATVSDAFQELEENEINKLVFSILNKMPEDEKSLLLLYHKGLKYKEIAKVLEINPSSVGTMLVRAINKLKLLLKTEYHELFR